MGSATDVGMTVVDFGSAFGLMEAVDCDELSVVKMTYSSGTMVSNVDVM